MRVMDKKRRGPKPAVNTYRSQLGSGLDVMRRTGKPFVSLLADNQVQTQAINMGMGGEVSTRRVVLVGVGPTDEGDRLVLDATLVSPAAGAKGSPKT